MRKRTLRNSILWFTISMAAGMSLAALNAASQEVIHTAGRPFAANVVIPQTRAFGLERNADAQITGVEARVDIDNRVALTTLWINLHNPTGRRIEAEVIAPVPDGASVRDFAFQGGAEEGEARILPKDEARSAYDRIVAKTRDPALLEFVGYNLIRSSVFPIEPNGDQKVRLRYEQILGPDGDRIDYVLPRSESLDNRIPWTITASIADQSPIATVYSPSHAIQTSRDHGAVQSNRERRANRVQVRFAAGNFCAPGPFRLSYLLERDGLSASLFAYPDPSVGGGYFLLLAGLPPLEDGPKMAKALKREVTLVFDRSGSMKGEKIEQVREAALQILAGLEDGETFNIIAYNDSVDPFCAAPVEINRETERKARDFLNPIKAQGSTNIHEALTQALRQRPSPNHLPIVLFLTDGLPTTGNTSEAAIRDVAIKRNPYNRRVFTFGVGADVNTPLLDRIATETRAASTYVLPGEDVEVKVAQTFKRLSGPILADTELEIMEADGKPAMGRTRDILPAWLPDLFDGDQLVLLGQYLGDDSLEIRIAGNYLGKERKFTFAFDLDKATTRHSFVPRLWASRKIGALVDAVRQSGADADPGILQDERLAAAQKEELIEEIVRLSAEFGILTEYTAFLAQEGVDLTNQSRLLSEANTNFDSRAIQVRTGMGAVNQSSNIAYMSNQSLLNMDNGMYNAEMEKVEFNTIHQLGDRTFYQRNGEWADMRAIDAVKNGKTVKEIQFGSPEHQRLMDRLAAQGRQADLAQNGDVLVYSYDSTNGTASEGDVYRVKN